jgi:EAL domain-containing protein (putative c-di-GMP-specific phosphodiesterase class I)
VGVNASGVEIDDPAYPARVRAALTRSGLDPRRLVLEVTETAAIGDLPAAGARLATLRDLGVRVAVDDFGTGFSSLRYLDLLPVDILKIDRSFVAGVDPAGRLPAVVRRHLAVARARGLEVLAEGVERASQRVGLCAGGCRLGQGYLFSPPLGAPAARRFLGSALPAAAAARTAESAARAVAIAERADRPADLGPAGARRPPPPTLCRHGARGA